MSEENLKVALRVRPFNKRELDAKATLIVSMSGNQTEITDPKTKEVKKYAYDYSYWSFDGFSVEPNGYNKGTSPKYADQQRVFDDMGVGVLKNAWEGYNATLFAYGQTGSGKSYSVVGYGENKGIVPKVCENIFLTAAQITDKTIEVNFSMLEIYSEVVRDLLNPSKDRKQGLQIRQDPKNGFYPVGITKKLVTQYAEITKLTDEGTANRTIASTNMNATSSRAHTIVTVILIQKYKNEAGQEMAKTASINLVDLAGSERQEATGATGDRLKEGAAINLSLTSLGNVISALADNSAGKNVQVPYRDSVLTKLLMNALGGNSKTVMIAAISPADINFDENVSTCRYADRAKQIKTKAMINEDPTEKLIRDLREENARLKKALEAGHIDPDTFKDIKDNANGDKAQINELVEKEKEAMRKQLEENEKAKEDLKKSYEEKLAALEAEKENEEVSERSVIMEKAKTVPHISNVNMDPSLSATIKYLLEGDGKKTIGLPEKSDIGLNGIGIMDPHCAITVAGAKFTIEKLTTDAKVLVNGRSVTSPIDLSHLDRIVFGCSQYFLFINPANATVKDSKYPFEAFQDEISKVNGATPSDSEKRKMTQEELLCSAELRDLLPHIEEANQISIQLDKKVKYTAVCLSAPIRGEYDGTQKVAVRVKHFSQGLEWYWTKEKFLDRKNDMSEYFLDLKEDGKIDKKKFERYDPFFESPDTPTQIGTAILSLKSIGYLLPIKDDFRIIDLKSRKAGKLSIEVIPCDDAGKPIVNKMIRNPATDLANQKINFIFKLNAASDVDAVFEDIYCQFQIPGDKTIYRTDVIKGTNKPDFKFNKMFTFTVTPDFLEFLLKKEIYIQIWGEQKHPDPSKINDKISTKEYFDKEKESAEANINGKMEIKSVDPEVQRLKEENRLLKMRIEKDEETIQQLMKLMQNSKGEAVDENDWTDILIAAGFQIGSQLARNSYNNSESKTCSIL